MARTAENPGNNRRVRREVLLGCGVVVFLLTFFFTFAGGGLGADFSRDDLMNLHGYLQQGAASILKGNLFFWSTSYRPLGGVFYLASHQLFGFDPLPLRLLCFALLLTNLWLAFRFVQALSASTETGVLAALMLTYHAWFVDLYYSSGTIYELLCFFFYFGALGYYARIRLNGDSLRARHWAVILPLYVCALNAKEMAVTLPLFLGLFELIYFPPGRQPREWLAWIGRQGRAALVTGGMTIPYVIVKLTGEGSLTEVAAYRPEISAGRFLDGFHLYLNPLFYQEHFFRDPNTIQLLLVMIGFALWRRSRPMIFGWLFLLLSPLPFIFIPHHVAMFLYIPSAGWALYIAAAIADLRSLVAGVLARVNPRFRFGEDEPGRSLTAALTFLLLATGLAFTHRAESPKTMALFANHQPDVRGFLKQMDRLQPKLEQGSRILFLDDPFPVGGDYSLLFALRLHYDDLSLEIGRRRPDALPPDRGGDYDAAFTWRNGILASVADASVE